ncbi:MAG TPA: hypothetical protein VMT58_06935 [Candidatus Binataceae bacterium]|nr:hypothetical protein [Candidatus Binataceae bacterium]
MKKMSVALAAALFGAAFAVTATVHPAYAAKVDCDAVMKELDSGKKIKEVATDLKVSKSSVYRCKKKAKATAAKAAGATKAAAPAPAPSSK